MSLLLALAVPAPTAVDAERDFAAMAQTEGQWTAFRRYAAPDALMFAPERVNAQQWLADRADPPSAVMWWPGRSWVSCDGTLAVNTGPWIRDGGRLTGTFTTVWQRQPDGSWKWLLDHGRATPSAVPAGDQPQVTLPECRVLQRRSGNPSRARSDIVPLVQLENRVPGGGIPDVPIHEGDVLGGGGSPDGSLRWEVRAVTGAEPGARVFRVWTLVDGGQHLALYELSGVPLP